MKRPSESRSPASPGELRYLLSLSVFPTEAALGKALGTSARYVRWMLSGQKPGYKHASRIRELYDHHRRERTPQRVGRVRRKARRGWVPVQSVVRILRHIFQPIDARVIPTAERPWQHTRTQFCAHAQAIPREEYDTWDAFYIARVTGIGGGEKVIRRYTQGGPTWLEFVKDEEDDFDTGDYGEDMPEWLELMWHRFDRLSKEQKAIVAHLPIEEWLEAIGEDADKSQAFNFWVVRMSEAATEEYATRRDPRTVMPIMEANAQDAVEMANSGNPNYVYDLIGVYAYTGWKKKHKKR